MIGSIGAGFITGFISPRITLTFVYLLRAVLIAIFVFVPTTETTAIIFSCLFGVSTLYRSHKLDINTMTNDSFYGCRRYLLQLNLSVMFLVINSWAH